VSPCIFPDILRSIRINEGSVANAKSHGMWGL
jgi:hypothetical protein